jgi:hypothetical protein
MLNQDYFLNVMSKRSYTCHNGQPVRHVMTERAKFREATSSAGASRRERDVVLSLTKHVGRVAVELDLAMTHREAVKMVKAVAACIAHEGTPKSSEAANNVLEVSHQWDRQGAPRPAHRRSAEAGPKAAERLLDDAAFQDPEHAVGKLDPVRALRLLEEAEPRLAAYAERRMAAVLEPLRAAGCEQHVVLQVHREVVAMLVTSLLTLRQAYRDLYEDLLPKPPRAAG